MNYKKNYVIAYSVDNTNTAAQIVNGLKPAGFSFKHVTGDAPEDVTGLFERLNNVSEPILLLVSDNFLKSKNCMHNSYTILQKLINANKIYPIIVDGRYKIEGSNDYRWVATSFDRVSHVIQYMNYWQDQYLEMRKIKRKIDPKEEPQFADKLKIVRDISSEIGEFLRVLRNAKFTTLDSFSKNNYQTFFEHFEIPQEQFATTNSNDSENNLNKSNDVSIETNKKVVKANSSPPSNDQSSSDNVNSDEIPGMDMMAKAAAPITGGVLLNEMLSKSSDKNTDKIDNNIRKSDLDNLFDDDDPDERINESKEELDHQNEDGEEEEKALLEKLIKYKKGNNTDVPLLEDIDLKINKKDVKSSDTTIEPESILDEKPIDKSIKEQSPKDEIYNHLFETEEEDDDDEWDEDEIIPSESEIGKPHFNLEFMDDEEDINEHRSETEVLDDIDDLPEEADSALSDMEQIMHEASNHIHNGEIEKGLAILKYSLEREPDNIALRYQYAVYLADYANNTEAATVQLEKLLKKDKKNENACMRLAKMAEMKQDYLLAKSYYEKVANINPDYPGIHYHLGLITSAHSGEKSKQALKYFKKAVKKDKYNSETHYRYARALSNHPKNSKKAIKHLRKTIALEPYHPVAYADLISIYTEQGETAKAEKIRQEALKFNPDFFNIGEEEVFTIESIATAKVDDHALPLAEQPVIKVNKNANTVVCITGATSGIGKATAELFAKKGYKLIITGRRYDRLDELKSTFEENHDSQVLALPFDVRDLDSVKNAIDKLQDEWSNVDILINNAGLAKGKAPIHEGDIEDWDTMIDTNIKGLLYMTRAIAPNMVKNKKGHIVNVCSTAGREVYPNGNVYCATKFAVDAITKSTRLDLFKHNIRVSQVSPGHVEETEFALVRFDGNEEKSKVYEDFNPLTSKDVAASIYFIVNQPKHVNIQDILMMGTQQAGNNHIDRSGRDDD